jgi:hypothetical protein
VTSRKFFFLLWRVNAVVIFILGLLGSVALAVVVVLLYHEATRERQVTDVLNVTDERVADSKTKLGEFKAIAGSPVLRAELHVEQEYETGSRFSSGSKESSSTQNYLFFDPGSDSSYWLLPGFKGIIHSTTELPESDYGDTSKPMKAVFYELIERDSNEDGQLTPKDTKEIAISDPAGTRLIRALKGIESFNSVHLLPDERAAIVLYGASGQARAARIELATGKVVNDVALKPLQDPQQSPAR